MPNLVKLVTVYSLQESLSQAGEKLSTDDVEIQKEALAIMFVIRERIINLTRGVAHTSIQDIHNQVCYRDIVFFSAMVHDLLTYGNKRPAMDVMSRYASISGALDSHFWGNKSLRYPIRDFTLDSFPKNESDTVFKEIDLVSDALNIRIAFHEIGEKLRDQKHDKNKSQLAIDIVYTWRLLQNLSTTIRESEMYMMDEVDQEILDEWYDEFMYDISELWKIVLFIVYQKNPAITESIIKRMEDLARKLGEMIQTGNTVYLMWPHEAFYFPAQ